MSATYLKEKLNDIVYTLTVHEGNATMRLAYVYKKLLVLPKTNIPQAYKGQYNEMMGKLAIGCRTSAPGLTPSKVRNIQNRTASKYIALLVKILHYLERGG